ncbi:regulatory protein GemA [Desulfocastanea catecholica]
MAPTKAQLAKIHIAKKELDISDEIYRDILHVNFAVESSSKLNETQAAKLLDIFAGKGWKSKSKSPATGRKQRSSTYIAIKPGPTAAQQRKVLAMWNQLGYAMDTLHTRCQRQFKVDRFEWLTDREALHVLITDLDQRIKLMKGEK